MTDLNPFRRCAVCGFRRLTHWLIGSRDFYTVCHIDPPPRRRWWT